MKLPRFVPTKVNSRAITNYVGEPKISNSFFAELLPAVKLETQACSCNNSSTNSATDSSSSQPRFIYAYGSIAPRFPSLSAEKEFYQAADENEVTLRPELLFFKILSKAENLYIAREMCWVFQIDGIDSYVIFPKSETELTQLIASIGTSISTIEFDVLIGEVSSSSVSCNNLNLPGIVASQIYSISNSEFIIAVEVATMTTPAIASELVAIMFSYADNAGVTDADRAINFVSLRYMGAYQVLADIIYPVDTTTHQHSDTPKSQLIRVNTEPARVRGGRNILSVIFSFQNLNTGVVQKWFCEVDVSSEFPFLVTGMAIYSQR